MVSYGIFGRISVNFECWDVDLSGISLILGEKHEISGLAYLGRVELVLDRSKTVRGVFVGKI